MSGRAVLAVSFALAAVAACSAFSSSGDGSPTSAGPDDAALPTRGDASDDGPATTPDASSAPCPTGDGPSMVVVSNGTTTVCVDATEVTSAQYRAYYERVQQTSSTTPLPTTAPPGCGTMTGATLSAPGAPLNRPQVQVSFCSAAHYCNAQGKRLCGDLKGKGSIIGSSDIAPVLEWEVACAAGGAPTGYPWGSDGAQSASLGCWTADLTDAGAPRATGIAQSCGPPSRKGPWDMIGNVWEWVNLRVDVDGGVSYSAVRGGSYGEPTVASGCSTAHGFDGASGSYAPGNERTGFRCCADPR